VTQADLPRRVLSGTTARHGTSSVDRVHHCMSDEPFISPAALARRWGQSVETVRRSVRTGLLEGQKLPGARRWLIPMDQVRRLEMPFDPTRLKSSTH